MGIKKLRICAVLLALAFGVPLAIAPSSADAATREYSATETIPVPPATGFQGSGGGDGWAVALTPSGVFNVHHHNSTITVACRKQVDASPCWTAPTKEVVDGTGGTFSTLHPGLHLDQGNGHLYVYGTRSADGVAGVVCIDTAVADANPNPFCGFSALSGAGQSAYGFLTNGVDIGSRFYAVSHDNGSGTATKVLCFDAATVSGCTGQPFAFPEASASGQVNTIAAIGTRLYIPQSGSIGCFDASSVSACAGLWPATAATGFGAPFPLLSNAGAIIGVCNPDGAVPCFALSGSVVATPAGLASAVGSTQYWNGPSVTIGPRVYVPSGTTNAVDCYDYANAAPCPNFPHQLPGAGYMYTVNADPQRPSCLWVNADNGSAQIQNFDAYGGVGCGEGPIRVLASSIVVDSPKCAPTTYTSVAILNPARSQYGSGSVAFADGSGQQIGGIADVPIDATGTANLKGLNLSTTAGLPQFLITLNAPTGTPGSVTVRLTWSGDDDPACNPNPGTVNHYVALGDSYSSGEGNPPFLAGTDTKTNNLATTNVCHRSTAAFGPQAAAASHLSQDSFTFAACSGAILADISESVGGAGQWDARPQLDSIAPVDKPNGAVDQISLTIGGNDLGFADAFTSCVRGLGSNQVFHGDCRHTLNQISTQGLQLLRNGGTIQIDKRDGTWKFCGPGTRSATCGVARIDKGNQKYFVTKTVASLAGMFGKMRDRAPNAHIVVLLYPHLFPTDPPRNCIVGQALSRGGVTHSYTIDRDAAVRFNQIGDDLDAAIMESVTTARSQGVNVDFVETRDAFYGHWVQCINDPNATSDPWINGLVFDNATVLTVSPSPFSFHPNGAGQASFAALYEAKR